MRLWWRAEAIVVVEVGHSGRGGGVLCWRWGNMVVEAGHHDGGGGAFW